MADEIEKKYLILHPGDETFLAAVKGVTDKVAIHQGYVDLQEAQVAFQDGKLTIRAGTLDKSYTVPEEAREDVAAMVGRNQFKEIRFRTRNDDVGVLTLKSGGDLQLSEVEFDIGYAKAHAALQQLPHRISKIRYSILDDSQDVVWFVDDYQNKRLGDVNNLVIVEVKLKTPHQANKLTLPEWLLNSQPVDVTPVHAMRTSNLAFGNDNVLMEPSIFQALGGEDSRFSQMHTVFTQANSYGSMELFQRN